MYCYTWHRGEVVQGIAVNSEGIIILGEEGRCLEKVRCFPNNPPEVQNGFIYEAHPLKKTVDENDYFMFAKPDDADDTRVLVRILTEWVSTRSTMGSWESLSGSAENLIVGYGFRGESRSIGCWSDGLVMMLPSDVIKITPEGGYKTEIYTLFYDESGVHSMQFDEYIATVNIDIESCLIL